MFNDIRGRLTLWSTCPVLPYPRLTRVLINKLSPQLLNNHIEL